MRYIDTGSRDPNQSLARWLQTVLAEEISELRIQTGYFSHDALGLFLPTFLQLTHEHRLTRIIIGSNDGCTLGSHVAALAQLLGLPRPNAQLGVVQFAGAFFHPKVYYFQRADGTRAAYVGSANLTPAGLSLHVEAGISLDTRENDPNSLLSDIADSIDQWFEQARPGLVFVNSAADIANAVQSGLLCAAPPPPPPTTNPGSSGGAGSSGGHQNSSPHLQMLVPLPSVTPLTAPTIANASGAAPQAGAAPPTTPPAAPIAGNVATPKLGFPQYILFDPTAATATVGPAALTGSQLPGGAVGLVIQWNRDSARHFAGGDGTANISIPVATISAIRFGVYGKHHRPRAEFALRVRYVGSSAPMMAGVLETNVMGYGFADGESGHGDIRMLVPKDILGLIQNLSGVQAALPTVGDLALLEWPSPLHPEFRLTLLEPHSEIANAVSGMFNQAVNNGQQVGNGACWLAAGVSPPW